MIRAALLSLALSLSPQTGRAQEARGHFDPIVYIGTFNIFTQWATGVFLHPPHARLYYLDSLMSNGYPVGFTMVVADSAPGGWTLRMQFDADNFGALKLVKVDGSKAVADSAREKFAALEHWTLSVLGKKLLDRMQPTENKIVWKWIPRAGYAFEIARRVSEDAGAPDRLTIALVYRVE